ncbi:uncharacterized protein [Nicotiana tomentosiformis]|uniref:uncharacterized protein n=1 Tax=Nicotiana tomentosiformis TaxID=4098 RepID=UPI00388CECB8
MKKTPREIVTILDELSEDANQWPSESAERRRTTGVHQVDANTSVQVQLDVMAKEIRKLTLTSIHSETHAACDICGRGHPTHEFQALAEEINVVGNYNFNAMGQRDTDFSWSSPGEDLMKSFIQKTDEKLEIHSATIREHGAAIKKIVEKKKEGKKGTEKKKKDENSRRGESEESKHMSALPFPQKLYREKLNRQFERFLDMLKQVNVNLPFIEVLSQIPAYSIFLKEILTKKRKIEETSALLILTRVYVILIGEIRSVPISLQLADQTTLIPAGIVEDVLVRVDKFVFPIDFIVVNTEKNKEVPIILGRPFLATGRAILDIHERRLMLRVGEGTMTFEMNVETGVKKEKPTANIE